jgi:hypothetical protein
MRFAALNRAHQRIDPAGDRPRHRPAFAEGYERTFAF